MTDYSFKPLLGKQLSEKVKALQIKDGIPPWEDIAEMCGYTKFADNGKKVVDINQFNINYLESQGLRLVEYEQRYFGIPLIQAVKLMGNCSKSAILLATGYHQDGELLHTEFYHELLAAKGVIVKGYKPPRKKNRFRMRSWKRMILDFVFLSIHIGKWVFAYFLIRLMIKESIGTLMGLVIIFGGLWLTFFILRDLYWAFKAVVTDTLLGSSGPEGEFSYLRALDSLAIQPQKIKSFTCLAIATIGVIGVVNNVIQWSNDGENRLLYIIVSGGFAYAPLKELLLEAKRNK